MHRALSGIRVPRSLVKKLLNNTARPGTTIIIINDLLSKSHEPQAGIPKPLPTEDVRAHHDVHDLVASGSFLLGASAPMKLSDRAEKSE